MSYILFLQMIDRIFELCNALRGTGFDHGQSCAVSAISSIELT